MDRKIENLLNKYHIISYKTARKHKITKSLLHYYIQKGQLIAIDEGIYSFPDYIIPVPEEWQEMYFILNNSDEGAICLISALSLYELTDEIPREHWIAIPYTKRKPQKKNIHFIRFRNMKLGLTKIKVGNVFMPIFNQERTIIDSFRLLTHEIALKALKKYLHNKDTNIQRLVEYSKKLKIDISKYIVSLTA